MLSAQHRLLPSLQQGWHPNALQGEEPQGKCSAGGEAVGQEPPNRAVLKSTFWVF